LLAKMRMQKGVLYDPHECVFPASDTMYRESGWKREKGRTIIH
jgi:hypothetical protein